MLVRSRLRGIIRSEMMRPPTASYLICATPRSGSTLLCDLLARTGVAGAPEEFFQALPETGKARHPRHYLGRAFDREVQAILGDRSPVDDEPGQVAAAGCASYGEYLDAVLERGSTRNGVFGGKVMWGYLEGLVWHLRRLPGPVRGSDYDVLAGAFPGLRLIHHTRRDRLRQAISLWRALQTWTWRHEPGAEPAEPAFHRGAIVHLARSLDADDEAWERFFAEAGVVPIRVQYEDLVTRPQAAIAGVLDTLDLPVPAGVGERTGLARQADDLSEEWAARCL
jgi:LPS sulfotransferase NodH